MIRPKPPDRAATAGDGARSPRPGGRHGHGSETTPADEHTTTEGRVCAAALAHARTCTEAAIREAVMVGTPTLGKDGTESRMVRVETGAGTLMFLKVYLAPDGGLEVRHYRL